MALAFRVDGPADVDSAYDELLALGYKGHKAPWDAVVHDPDGNTVDLFASLLPGGTG